MSKYTAIKRKKPSAPMAWLESNGWIRGNSMLDFGCGRGDDADYYALHRYDPNWFPTEPAPLSYDVIFCTYVLNVLTEEEQNATLQKLWWLSGGGAGRVLISVRRDLPKEGRPGRGCYQRYVELDMPILVQNSKFCIYLMSN